MNTCSTQMHEILKIANVCCEPLTNDKSTKLYNCENAYIAEW